MFGMSVHTTAIVLAIVLAGLGLAYLLFGWLRKRSGRVLLRGIGFVLMPVGLLVMGLMDRVVDGINAVVDWANATYPTLWVLIGLGLAGVGLLCYLVGSFVPHVSGEEAAQRRQAIHDRKLAALQSARPTPAPTSAPATAAPLAAVAAPIPTPPPSHAASSDAIKPVVAPPTSADDKEIDDILRRHGIE